MARIVVYVRRPRPRSGREDPIAVQWTQANERELWQMLRASNNDLQWPELASHFRVPLIYILQQAAWLYEKELKLLQQKMTQINVRASALAATPGPETPPPRPLSSVVSNPQSPSSPRVSLPVSRTRPSTNEASNSNHTVDSLSIRSNSDSDSVRNSGRENTHFTRRLLSVSRTKNQDDFASSQSLPSLEDFVPAHWQPANSSRDNSPSDTDFGSSSENSVTQSALEEALLDQTN